jgi:hypothetical protein
MNLLARAKSLIEDGRLSACAVIAVAPLAACTVNADVSFNPTDAPTFDNYDMDVDNYPSGNVDNTLSTDYGYSAGVNQYSYSLNMGGSGSTDVEWFGDCVNYDRAATFDMTGTYSGALDAGQAFNFDYSLTTFLDPSTATEVSYSLCCLVADASGKIYYSSDSELGSFVDVYFSKITLPAANAACMFSTDTLSFRTYTMSAEEMTTYAGAFDNT